MRIFNIKGANPDDIIIMQIDPTGGTNKALIDGLTMVAEGKGSAGIIARKLLKSKSPDLLHLFAIPINKFKKRDFDAIVDRSIAKEIFSPQRREKIAGAISTSIKFANGMEASRAQKTKLPAVMANLKLEEKPIKIEIFEINEIERYLPIKGKYPELLTMVRDEIKTKVANQGFAMEIPKQLIVENKIKSGCFTIIKFLANKYPSWMAEINYVKNAYILFPRKALDFLRAKTK